MESLAHTSLLHQWSADGTLMRVLYKAAGKHKHFRVVVPASSSAIEIAAFGSFFHQGLVLCKCHWIMIHGFHDIV